MTAPVLCLFTTNLRLADHPALDAAVRIGTPVIPLYVLDDEGPAAHRLGGAARWWLHHSLSALAKDLATRGSRLILRRGSLAATVADVTRETGATQVFFTRRYGPDALTTEASLNAALTPLRATARRFGGQLLWEPEDILTATGTPYKVFTPFYNAAKARGAITTPLPAPAQLPAPPDWPRSDALADWRLTPGTPDWAAGFSKIWQPGEAGAQAATEDFLSDAVVAYTTGRDMPGRRGTSRLSPHLHFGEISPRSIWHRAHFAASAAPAKSRGTEAFLREIAWREFSHHLLHHFPTLPDSSFRPEFENFPWVEDAVALACWQRGQTGYPIVDAGMRELWATGWMHNRVRMIVASFLVKDLMIHWRHGAAWFWDTLVDADLAANSANWQWVAGSGADAAPYFRVFNPVLQGRKFDPDGAYVRRWVPEITALPDRFIHAPWDAPEPPRAAVYPAPMVDHAKARARALAAFKALAH